jgi:tetratricopeptide (TPR) repeat protein
MPMTRILISGLLMGSLLLAGCKTPSHEENEQDSIIRAGDRVQAGGDPSLAIQVYESALKKNPPHKLPLYLKLGEAHMKADQIDQAKKIYEEALPYDENDEVKIQLGRLYISSAQPDSALTIFDKILASRKDDSRALNGKGVALDLKGKHVLAQECYVNALLSDESNKDIQSNLGLSLAFEGRYEDAFKWLKPIGESLGASSKQRHNLALAYALSGDTTRAQDLFSRDMSTTEVNENLHILDMVSKSPAMTKDMPDLEKKVE